METRRYDPVSNVFVYFFSSGQGRNLGPSGFSFVRKT